MQHTPQLVHSYNHITFQWRESVKKIIYYKFAMED